MSKVIVCLPVAGAENPYQRLMMNGIRSESNLVVHGCDTKFFSITRSLMKFPKAEWVHFDWIHRYYTTRFKAVLWLFGLIFFLDIALAKLFFRKAQWVWTLHNIYPHDRGKTGYDKLVRTMFAKQCKKVRVFSNETKEVVIKEFRINAPVFCIPEGSYIDAYSSSLDRINAIKRKANFFTFLFIGQIRNYKGIPELITEFKVLEEKYRVRLIIAGKIIDENLQYLTDWTLNEKNIELYNRFIGDDELASFFDVADIVVLPFRKVENSGSVILAMGFKKAILAPAMGVLPARLQQQKELLYDDLGAGMKNCLNYSKHELNRLGRKNYDALEGNDWSNFARVFS